MCSLSSTGVPNPESTMTRTSVQVIAGGSEGLEPLTRTLPGSYSTTIAWLQAVYQSGCRSSFRRSRRFPCPTGSSGTNMHAQLGTFSVRRSTTPHRNLNQRLQTTEASCFRFCELTERPYLTTIKVFLDTYRSGEYTGGVRDLDHRQAYAESWPRALGRLRPSGPRACHYFSAIPGRGVWSRLQSAAGRS
jgi:hypothetical protein